MRDRLEREHSVHVGLADAPLGLLDGNPGRPGHVEDACPQLALHFDPLGDLHSRGFLPENASALGLTQLPFLGRRRAPVLVEIPARGPGELHRVARSVRIGRRVVLVEENKAPDRAGVEVQLRRELTPVARVIADHPDRTAGDGARKLSCVVLEERLHRGAARPGRRVVVVRGQRRRRAGEQRHGDSDRKLADSARPMDLSLSSPRARHPTSRTYLM